MARLQILSLGDRLDIHPGATGAGVCMAFVDLGFYPHPDLLYPRKRVLAFADAVRDAPLSDEFFLPRPRAWHGMMTACAAAGNGYLSAGHYRGPAPDADVVLIQAAGPSGEILGKNVAAAIRFPLRHPGLGVRILNVSLGVDPDDPDAADVARAVREVVAAGITVFAAAGNDPSRPPEPPGSVAEAITVGGQDDGNTRDAGDDRPWSSSHGHLKPDLLAPAVLLPAPMLPGTREAREAAALFQMLGITEEHRAEGRFGQGGEGDPTVDALFSAIAERIVAKKYLSPDYQHVDGTSFASPITAAVAAQMLEVAPTLTPAKIRAGLIATALPLPRVSRVIQGHGVLQPREAVDWALAHR